MTLFNVELVFEVVILTLITLCIFGLVAAAAFVLGKCKRKEMREDAAEHPTIQEVSTVCSSQSSSAMGFEITT